MSVGVELACCFDDEGEDGQKWLVGLFVDYGGGAYKEVGKLVLYV